MLSRIFVFRSLSTPLVVLDAFRPRRIAVGTHTQSRRMNLIKLFNYSNLNLNTETNERMEEKICRKKTSRRSKLELEAVTDASWWRKNMHNSRRRRRRRWISCWHIRRQARIPSVIFSFSFFRRRVLSTLQSFAADFECVFFFSLLRVFVLRLMNTNTVPDLP